MEETDSPKLTLTAQEAAILDARLSGKSMRKIAEEMGCDHSNISQHLAKPHVKAESERRTAGALEAARQRYCEMLPVLVDQEISIALGKAPADAPTVKALQNALDRAGMVPTKKTELSGQVETVALTAADREARRAEILARAERRARGEE